MSRFFSGDPVDKSRFFGGDSLGIRTPDAQYVTGIDLNEFGDLVKDSHGLITGSPFDLDDLAAENQAGGTQIVKGLGRAVGSTALKLGQGVAMMGTAIYEMGKHEFARTNPALAAQMGISANDLNLENITDNFVVNSLFKTEEAMKESPWFKIYKPSDWDDRSIWQQLGSTAWWADEFADGAAFALQAYIGAGVMGGARLGTLTFGTNRAGQAKLLAEAGRAAAGQAAKKGAMGGMSQSLRNFYSQTARGLSTPKWGQYGDFMSQVGMMTANEALFEARDIGHVMQAKLLEEYIDTLPEEDRIDVNSLSTEEQLDFINSLPDEIRDGIKERKGRAMQNTFVANMAAISFSNVLEVAALNKYFGQGIRRIFNPSSTQAATRGINVGKSLYDKAEIIQRKGVQRFIGRGSRPRVIAATVGGQALSEGLYEENIQNSIANISEQFDGAANLDYIKDVVKDALDNTFSGDKDAWKSIVTGGILGGLMGIGAGARSHNEAQKKQKEIVTSVNASKANLVNLKDIIIKKDADGKPILEDGKEVIDREALLKFAANQEKALDIADIHDLYKEAGNADIADVLWNDAITDIALSYMEAGFGEDLLNQVKSIGTIKESEAQENGLNETSETKEDGKTSNINDKAKKMLEIAENVKRDYESITSIIPNTEENNLRINTAVRINSRLRKLNERKSDYESRFDALRSKFKNNIVLDINSKIDRIEGLNKEIKRVREKYPEAAKKLERQVNLLKKEVEQTKELNRNSLKEQGVDVPFGMKRVEETDNQPARLHLDKLNKRIPQFESAIETQLEKYNNLVVDGKGLQDEIVKRIKKAKDELDKITQMNEELASVSPGDFVELTRDDGTKEIVPIKLAANGSILFGNRTISREQYERDYMSLRVLTQEERAEHINNLTREYRKSQLANRIEGIKRKINDLLDRQLKQTEALAKAEDSLESLRLQKQRKLSRTSERQLDGKIRKAEELIRTTQAAIGELDSLIIESNQTIEELETMIQEENVDITLLHEELEILKKAHEETQVERKEAETFLETLNRYYNSLKSRWRRLFPDKDRVFEEFEDIADFQESTERASNLTQGLPANMRDLVEEDIAEDTGDSESPSARAYQLGLEYSNFFSDMVTTAEEVSEQERIINALKVRERYLKRRIEQLEKEAKQYESFLTALESPGEFNPLPGQSENTENPRTVNGKYKEKDVPVDGQSFAPRKNIADGLFTTTGNSGSSSPIMQRWFKFTETVSLGANNMLMLMPVTIHHPLYGIGGKYDLFSSEPEAYRNINNIKVIPVESVNALAEGGFVPYRIDGEVVHTSLIEISRDGKETFDSFTFKSGEHAGTPMFHNRDGLTNEVIGKIIEEYRTLINSIKDKAEKGEQPSVLFARGKSWGHINSDGVTRSAPEAFGRVPKMKVNLKSDTKNMSTSYDIEIGMGYVWHNGRPIPAEARKINNEEAQEILKLLKALSKDPNRAKENNPLLNRLKSVIFMGKSKDSKFSTYFVAGNKNFAFGENIITLSDLESGRYDSELIEHITELNHQISLKHLNSTDSYTSITGETYPSYNDYLLNPESNNRQNLQLPVKFDIVAPSENTNSKQVDGVYLVLGNKPKKSAKKKKKQTKAAAAQKDSENPLGLSYTTAGKIVTEANKKKSLSPEKEQDKHAASLEGAEERLANISDQAVTVTLDNGESYVIDRGQGAIFHAETGALISATNSKKEILDKEKEEYGEETPEAPPEAPPVSPTPKEETEDSGLEGFLNSKVENNPLEEFEDASETPPETSPEPDNTSSAGSDILSGFSSLTPEAKAAEKAAIKASKRNAEKKNDEKKPNNDAPFLLKSKVKNYEQADVQKEIEELERLVGSKALARIVSGLIQNKAFGLTLQDGRILLSDLMTEGTAYHEAFHRIFEGIVDIGTIRQIINEWKNNNKDKDLNDYQVIEELAEEFREYMLTNSQPDGILGRTFNYIKNFLRDLLGIPASARDQLFYKIRQGDFKDATVIRQIRPDAFLEVGSTLLRDNFGSVTEREVMEGLSFAFLQNLIDNNFDIDDILNFNTGLLEDSDSTRFSNIYNDSLQAVVQTIYKNRGTNPITDELVKTLFAQSKLGTRSRLFNDFSNYLQRYSITLNEEQENIPLTEDEKSKDTLGIISSIEFNVKSGVPNAIKLVLASLPSLNAQGKLNRNSLGLPKLSNYKRNLAVLHNQLAGLESLEEMRDKILELVDTFPEYRGILHRIGLPLAGPVINIDTPTATVRLQNQFRQQFDKANRTYFTHVYDEAGNSYFLDANSERAVDVIKQRWAANFRLLPKPNIVSVNGRFIYNPKFFNKFKGQLRDRGEILSFYKAMGIEFSNPKALTEDNIDTLRDTSKHFLDIIETGEVETLFDSELNIAGRINQLLEIELQHSVDFTDNQHINAEGKTVYGITLNTYLDIVIKKINNALPDFLKWDSKNNTGSISARNSLFLKDNKYKLRVDILGGSKVIEGDITDQGKGTDKLSRSETAIQHFTAIMNGIFPFIRQGDRKIEYAITLLNKTGERAKVSSLNIDTIQEVEDIFKGYLADEMMSMWMYHVEGKGDNIPVYRDAVTNLRLFEGVFTTPINNNIQSIVTDSNKSRAEIVKTIDAFVNRKAVKAKLTEYIDNKTKNILKEFVNNGVLAESEGSYINNGLPQEIVGDESLLSGPEIEQYMRRFTVLSLIGNIEQQKLFTGDFAFYKKDGNVHDFFKRTSGLGGTGKTLRNDSEYNDWLNVNMPREDRTINGKIDSWVFDDVQAKSSLLKSYINTLQKEFKFSEKDAIRLTSPYSRYDEADAQGYITFPEYREMLFRSGDWTTSQELIYQKIIAEESLTASDVLTFPPLKPQYFGPQEFEGLYVPTFYKLSLMPLIPGTFPSNSPLEQLRQDMENNGVGITTFTSGNKVGKLDGQPFYGENGNYNTGEKQLQILDYDYMKIQLDMTPEKHKRVTFGTQFRKLVLSNLMGKALYRGKSEKAGEDYIKEFTGLIKQQIELEKKDLFKKLGVQFKGDKITINKNKLAELLSSEAFKRAAPNNVIDDLNSVLAKGRNAEIMVTRGKMESILMSLMNNTIIHNKVFGDMFVQASSTGYEGTNRTKLQKDVKGEPWASSLSTLGFYEYGANGTKAMEIYVPHRFKELYGKDIDINSIDPRLLELIGFRIPTQGLNSIEVIKIKGFLPQEAGNTVIVPSEIVAKAGSDFDIDKLTLFLPNYKVHYSKQLKKDLLAAYPELAEEGSYSTLINGKQSYRFIDNIRTYEELEDQDVLDTDEKRKLELYKRFRTENLNDYIDRLEYVEHNPDNPTKEGVQNEIIKLSREIVAAPENFKDLIAPISSQLIKDEATYIESLKPGLIEEKGRGNYVDFDYIMSVREDFLTGKDGVGIAASNLTHHVLSQMAGLGIMITGTPGGPKTWMNLSHNGISDYIDLAGTRDSQNEGNEQAPTILDTISSFLNSFVDIAKDPFLRSINAGIDTAGTYFYLLRAGVPLRQAVLFMNQPIILDYLNNLKLGQSMARKAQGTSQPRKDIEDRTRADYVSQEEYDFNDTRSREEYLTLMNPENLSKAIRGKLKENEFNKMQNQVLSDFLEYERVAGKLVKLHQATNSDTKGGGPSLFSASDLLERYRQIREEGFFENVDKFETETIIGTFNESVSDTIESYSSVFTYLQRPAFRKIQNEIVAVARLNPYVPNDRIDRLASTIENDFISFMFQHSFTESGTRRGNLIESYFSGENSLPKQIAKIKDNNNPIKDNLLIQELYPILSSANTAKEKGKDFDNLKFFSRRIIKEHADDISNAWEELFALQPELANRIFMLSVLQSSFNNSPIEFVKYAPAKYSSEILRQAINLDAYNQDLDIQDFKERFFKNNMFNSDLIPFTRSGSRTFYGYKSNIEGNLLRAKKSAKDYPYVRTSVKRYPKRKGSKEKIHMLFRNTGEMMGEHPVFERVNALGNGFYFKEYTTDVSIVAQNNSYNPTPRTVVSTSIQSNKDILKSEILKNSEFSKEQKGRYIEMLEQSTSLEQIAAIRKEACK